MRFPITLLVGSTLQTVVDEGLMTYGAVTKNLDMFGYGGINLLFGDLTLLAASMNLYGSLEQDTKLDRLSRVAGLSEVAMSVAGSYMLRTGDYEKGATLLLGTMTLATGHMLITLGRLATAKRYRYS